MSEVIRRLCEYINQYQGRTPIDGLYNIMVYLYYIYWED